jgi:hypothetical protein
MKPCAVKECPEWVGFDRCYWHSKARWMDGGWTPTGLEALWLFGALKPLADVNGNGHHSVDDLSPRERWQLDRKTARGIRYVVSIGKERHELSV